MSEQDDQLKARIEADPRVQQLARSRQRGSMPGFVSAAELRRMGYPVTDDGWKYFATPLTKFGRPRVIDENDKYDRLIMAAGATRCAQGGAFDAHGQRQTVEVVTTIQLSDAERAKAFELYLKSGSGRAFAPRDFR